MDRWAVVAKVAASQGGVVRADQLLRAGFVRHDIATQCRSGRWRRLARGHYLVQPATSDDRVARIRAAVSDGYILAEADMAWLRARVIAEADGAGPHSLPDAVFADRHRQSVPANAGWLVLRFTWADTLRPWQIPDVVRAALVARTR